MPILKMLPTGKKSFSASDIMDDDSDDKDTKRKSRNLSEKKRRDQFNLLVNELSSMVSTSSRKMDKSTVLKATISFLRNHNEIAMRSRIHEIQEDWKPSFLTNEEFTHLVLEAVDGFIVVFSTCGQIFYVSENITSLLGYLPSELLTTTIFDVVWDEEHNNLYSNLFNPVEEKGQVYFSCHIRRGCSRVGCKQDNCTYELVHFVGYVRSEGSESAQDTNYSNSSNFSTTGGELDTRLVFVGIGRVQAPQLIREMSILDSSKNEFTSRHSLEWKFLFLDHRAPPIIGYLPFELLGTSGYDYYHVDDLEKVVSCHEALMQKGEGMSCYYRFLTKGQQWIWLQTRFYITYHQWNSKPEFIVCTHRVISYVDVLKYNRKEAGTDVGTGARTETELAKKSSVASATSSCASSATWGSKSTKRRHSQDQEKDRSANRNNHPRSCVSADSPTSKHTSSNKSCHQTTKMRRCELNAMMQHHMQKQSKNHQQQQQQQQQHEQVHFSQHNSDIDHGPKTKSFGNAIPTISFTDSNLNIVLPQQQQQQPPATPIENFSPCVLSHLPPVEMSLEQSQLQAELQRKHAELQALIDQQQAELRRVSEQLLMARLGLFPVPAASPSGIDPASNLSSPHLNNNMGNVNRNVLDSKFHTATPPLVLESLPVLQVEDSTCRHPQQSYHGVPPPPPPPHPPPTSMIVKHHENSHQQQQQQQQHQTTDQTTNLNLQSCVSLLTTPPETQTNHRFSRSRNVCQKLENEDIALINVENEKDNNIINSGRISLNDSSEQTFPLLESTNSSTSIK